MCSSTLRRLLIEKDLLEVAGYLNEELYVMSPSESHNKRTGSRNGPRQSRENPIDAGAVVATPDFQLLLFVN